MYSKSPTEGEVLRSVLFRGHPERERRAWPMPLTTHAASATRKPSASPMKAVATDQTAANSASAHRLPQPTARNLQQRIAGEERPEHQVHLSRSQQQVVANRFVRNRDAESVQVGEQGPGAKPAQHSEPDPSRRFGRHRFYRHVISKFPGQSRESLTVRHLSATIGGRQFRVPCTQQPRTRPPPACAPPAPHR